MDILPRELLFSILECVSKRDMLEARLVNRAWSAIATDVASDNICFTRRHLEPMVQHLAAGGRMQLTIKILTMKIKLYSLQVDGEISFWFDLLSNFLPLIGGVYDLEIVLKARDRNGNGISMRESVFLRDRYSEIVNQLVHLPSLRIVDLLASEEDILSMTPHLSTSLRQINIESALHFCDLQMVLTLLRHIPHLQNLLLSNISSAKVNGSPLRDFIYTSLVHERQYFNIEHLHLRIQYDDQQEPREVMAVVYFLLYLMPNLSYLYMDQRLAGATGTTVDSLPRLNDVRLPSRTLDCPANLTINTHGFTPSVAEFEHPSFFLHDDGTRVLESLSLCMGPGACPALLSQLPLSNVKSLYVREPYRFGFNPPTQATVMSLDAPSLTNIHLCKLWLQLPLLQSNTQVNSLSLDKCVLDSPAILEQTLQKMPCLRRLRLLKIKCNTWLYDPKVLLDNRWVALLSFFFLSAPQHPDSSLRWLSLPMTGEKLEIYLGTYQLEKRVHIVLQDANQSSGPCVQVWLDPLDVGQQVRQSVRHACQLPKEDVHAFLERVQDYREQLTAGAPLQHPSSPSSSSVDIAFNNFCIHQRATVYTCTSVNKVEITI